MMASASVKNVDLTRSRLDRSSLSKLTSAGAYRVKKPPSLPGKGEGVAPAFAGSGNDASG